MRARDGNGRNRTRTTPNFPGENDTSFQSGNVSGIVCDDPDLTAVIEAWANLRAEARAAIASLTATLAARRAQVEHEDAQNAHEGAHEDAHSN